LKHDKIALSFRQNSTAAPALYG
jgi:hypothetical protein